MNRSQSASVKFRQEIHGRIRQGCAYSLSSSPLINSTVSGWRWSPGGEMNIELDGQELATLLESLKYSKQRVQDAQGTPYAVRRENLDRLDAALEKVRAATRTSEP